MKHVVSCLLFFLLELGAFAQTIKKGELITVSRCLQIQVENQKGIRHQGSFFQKGDVVFTKIGAKIKVIKIDGDRAFVKYLIKGLQFGSSAPSRTRFYLSLDQIMMMKYDIPAI